MTLWLVFAGLTLMVLALLLAPLRRQLPLALAIAVLLPLGAGLLYQRLGAPGLPGQPFVQREKGPEFALTAAAAEMTVRLNANPDAKGYGYLAQTLFLLHRYDEAADAARKAIELGANDAGIWAQLGEAITMAAGMTVTPEALDAFRHAYTLDATEERTRFYLGLARAQAGKPREAVAIWRWMEKDAPADAPWLGIVQTHIASAAKEGGFAPDSVAPAAPVVDIPAK